MVKSIKIIMPENQRLKARLEKKMLEYEDRVARLKRRRKYDCPDIAYNSFNGYKAMIARRLYKCGEVQSLELARELTEEFGRLDTEMFNNAVQVIYDYCRTGGKNVKHGTGF